MMDDTTIQRLLRVVLVAGARDDCPDTDEISYCVFGEDRQKPEVWEHIFNCRECAGEALLFEWWEEMRFGPGELERNMHKLERTHLHRHEVTGFWQLDTFERAGCVLHVLTCEQCATQLRKQLH